MRRFCLLDLCAFRIGQLRVGARDATEQKRSDHGGYCFTHGIELLPI
jgi:hypothetical protein